MFGFLYDCRLNDDTSFFMRHLIFAASLSAIMPHGSVVLADEMTVLSSDNGPQVDSTVSTDSTDSDSTALRYDKRYGMLVVDDKTLSSEEQPDPATNDEATSSWSLGLGVAVIDYPHYPGSVQNETTIAPIPYMEYHSDRFDLGKDGLAAKVFQSGRLKLDLSVNGALPVSSKKNDLRTGMDDLELMIEFGPELEIR